MVSQWLKRTVAYSLKSADFKSTNKQTDQFGRLDGFSSWIFSVKLMFSELLKMEPFAVTNAGL
jgi:hypothetical protein